MKNSHWKYIGIVAHLLLWIVPTFLLIYYNGMTLHYLQGDLMDIPVLIGTLINAVIFYFNLFHLFPKYKSQTIRLSGYFLRGLVLLFVCSILENMFDYYYAKWNNPIQTVTLQMGEVTLTFLINVLFLIASVIYAIASDWIKNEMIKRKLTEENLRLELNYLKSQISPHFLFNTLNNLSSVAIKNNDDETARGLAKLSTLMRFMLDKSEKHTVRLSEEVEYLKSYIELQKLRFSDDDDIQIVFNINGDLQTFNLPPFLLINFVENAFKHGIDYEKVSIIDIELKVEDDRLFFRIENTIHQFKNKVKSSELGLNNVKKRLDLIYGNDYQLDLESTKEYYLVELTIKNLKP